MFFFPLLAHIPRFVTRRANKEVEYNGMKIPKGVSVMAATSCLNHDPKVWRNPSTFDTERLDLPIITKLCLIE